MGTVIQIPVWYLLAIAGLGSLFMGGFIMCLIHSAVLRSEIYELQDRLAELISYGPEDDDDDDNEDRPLVPIDPSARVPRNVTPR